MLPLSRHGSFDNQGKGGPASRRLSVNWRIGCLSRYESLSCVGAKFCRVNRVSPNEFRRFVAEFSRESTVQDVDMCSPLDSADYDQRGLSRALGEPLRLIRSMIWRPWIPPIGYFQPAGAWTGPLISKTLRFCPQCIAHGYHAIFHQLPWLQACLVHAVPLQVFSPGIRQSAAPRPRLKRPPDGDGDLIEGCARLLFSESSTWTNATARWWRSEMAIVSSSSAVSYLKWMKRISRVGVTSHPQAVVNLRDERVSLTDLVRMLMKGVAPPPAVGHAVSGECSSRYVIETPMAAKIVEELKQPPLEVNFEEILTHRIKSVEAVGENPVWRQRLARAVIGSHDGKYGKASNAYYSLGDVVSGPNWGKGNHDEYGKLIKRLLWQWRPLDFSEYWQSHPDVPERTLELGAHLKHFPLFSGTRTVTLKHPVNNCQLRVVVPCLAPGAAELIDLMLLEILRADLWSVLSGTNIPQRLSFSDPRDINFWPLFVISAADADHLTLDVFLRCSKGWPGRSVRHAARR